jgi:Flp pilus assembly protein TadG
MNRISDFVTWCRRLRDETGAATVEFALSTGVLLTVMLNGVEIARYFYIKMQLQHATQMAGQAVWKTCDTAAKVPVTINCSGRTSAITTALQSTSLGTGVTLSSGFPTEAYYCTATSGGALTSVGPVTSAKPINCSPTGSASAVPGTYVLIQAQYTYSPIFSGITIGSQLPSAMQASVTMRVR